MMRNKWLTAVTAAGMAALATPISAEAQTPPDQGQRARDPGTPRTATGDQGRMRGRDEEREKVHQMLKNEGKLSDAEIASLRGDMDWYLDHGGHGEQMRSLVHASLEAGCRGVCLAEAVRSMNHVMERGRSDKDAQGMVARTLHAEKQDRDRKKMHLSDAQAQERLRERMHERDRELDRDRMHDRTHEQGHDMQQGSGPGGSMGSGHMGR